MPQAFENGVASKHLTFPKAKDWKTETLQAESWRVKGQRTVETPNGANLLTESIRLRVPKVAF